MITHLRLTIGALSKRTGANIETIRYYARIGILPKPPRSTGGQRLYTNEHRQRLVFIRRARELGFSLDEVRALLQLTGGRRNACATVKSITEKHIADIRQRVRELNRLEHALSSMVNQCRGGDTSDCPILEALGT